MTIEFREVWSETKTSAWYPLNDIQGSSLNDLWVHINNRLGKRDNIKLIQGEDNIWSDNYNRQYRGLEHGQEAGSIDPPKGGEQQDSVSEGEHLEKGAAGAAQSQDVGNPEAS